MWKVKKFSDLGVNELYEIYRVRAEVFVEEQKILCADPDQNDKIAVHVFKTNGNELTAYGRIFLEDQHVTFGRILTTSQVRGTGAGQALLKKILETINDYFPNLPIEINAQFYITAFYQKNGFQIVGQPFMEAGVKHIKMIHPAM